MNWYADKNIKNAPDCDNNILDAKMNVVLISPEIAPNAGNISRLCYATNTILHIVGEPGFKIETDKHFKRAAVDYWDRLDIRKYKDFDAFIETFTQTNHAAPRVIMTSTNGAGLYFDFEYKRGDCIVFGPESSGIPPELIERYRDSSVRIPLNDKVRSLNLSTACGIILFHAIYSISGRRPL